MMLHCVLRPPTTRLSRQLLQRLDARCCRRGPPLQGSTRADVCVVGGGIAGCSAALALAERGYRVVLLEAQRLGWGASGRSGGQVI